MKAVSATVIATFAMVALAAGSLGGCGDDDGSSSSTADTTAPTPDTSGGDDTAVDTTDSPDDTTSTTACDPVAQTGCMDNENCTYGAGETVPGCVLEGAVAYSEACGGQDRCERGVCLSLNDTDNLCYKFCQSSSDCDNDGDCLELQNSEFSVCAIEGIYEECDLLEQNCEDGKACYSVSSEPEPICLPEGELDVDADCANIAGACKSGLVCVNSACKSLCDTSATDPCGADATCASYRGDAGYCDAGQ